MDHDTSRFARRRTHAATLLACAWIAVAATGCYRATFVEPRTAAGVEHDEWTDFFIFGLVGDEERAVSDYCGGPAARVRTGSNFATGLVSAITLGIYTPHKVYVTCTDPAATRALASGAKLEVAP